MSNEEYDYESALNNYRERLSEIKDAGERLVNAQSPSDVVRTAADTIGTPLSIELLKQGIKARFGQAAQSAKDKIDQVADDALSKISGRAQSSIDTVNSRISSVQNTLQDAQQQAEGLVGSVQNTLQDAQPAKNLTIDQTFNNPAFDKNYFDVPDQVEQAGRFGQNIGEEPTMVNALETETGRFTGGTEGQTQAMMDIINAKIPVGLNSLTDEQFNQAVQSRSDAILNGQARATKGELDVMDNATRARFDDAGRYLNRLDRSNIEGGLRGDSTIARALKPAQVVQPESEIETVASANMPRALGLPNIENDVSIGKNIQSLAMSNIAKIQRLTGANASDAAFEASTGRIAPDLVEGADTAADSAAGAIGAGEAVAESTGAETDGIGAIVGGVIALGGVLASIFSPHHESAPPPPPNLSRPAIQLGLG